MKTNLFLTGERGVGKSTCIRRCLEGLKEEPGGFRTWFADDAKSRLMLSDPTGGRAQVAARRQAGGFRVFEEVFEGHGVALLRPGREAGLVLMDELGKLESGCPQFRSAVLERLESPAPVLGVLRQGEGEWLDLLRRHPAMEILLVTADNREAVTAQVAHWLGLQGIR